MIEDVEDVLIGFFLLAALATMLHQGYAIYAAGNIIGGLLMGFIALGGMTLTAARVYEI